MNNLWKAFVTAVLFHNRNKIVRTFAALRANADYIFEPVLHRPVPGRKTVVVDDCALFTGNILHSELDDKKELLRSRFMDCNVLIRYNKDFSTNDAYSLRQEASELFDSSTAVQIIKKPGRRTPVAELKVYEDVLNYIALGMMRQEVLEESYRQIYVEPSESINYQKVKPGTVKHHEIFTTLQTEVLRELR